MPKATKVGKNRLKETNKTTKKGLKWLYKGLQVKKGGKVSRKTKRTV